MSYLALLFGSCLTDLMLKRLVEEKLPQGVEKRLFGGRVLLHKYHNDGLALGKCAGRMKEIRRGTLALLGIVGLHFLWLLPRRGRRLQKTGEAMVLGGGLCNWFDRFHQGYVTDYFSFVSRCEKLTRIVFNLSDLFIFAGSALAAAGSLCGGRETARRCGKGGASGQRQRKR